MALSNAERQKRYRESSKNKGKVEVRRFVDEAVYQKLSVELDKGRSFESILLHGMKQSVTHNEESVTRNVTDNATRNKGGSEESVTKTTVNKVLGTYKGQKIPSNLTEEHVNQIITLKKQGGSTRGIADEVGVSKSTVARFIDVLKVTGDI